MRLPVRQCVIHRRNTHSPLLGTVPDFRDFIAYLRMDPLTPADPARMLEVVPTYKLGSSPGLPLGGPSPVGAAR